MITFRALILSLIAGLGVSTSMLGQPPKVGGNDTIKRKTTPSTPADWLVLCPYAWADTLKVAPEFPGSVVGYNAYITKNLQYPSLDLDDSVEGTVEAAIFLDYSGKLRHISILYTPSASLGIEALRVLSEMPNWKPGSYNGRLVCSRITVPVNFSIAAFNKAKIAKTTRPKPAVVKKKVVKTK